MSKLVLKNVSRRYGTFEAVADFSLELKKGEFVSLLGPSGCGKTTTLRMIAGFAPPSTGTIEMDGQQISAPSGVVPPERRRMSMIFQSYAIWPNMTVGENVGFGLQVRKMSRAEIDRRVDAILDVVQMRNLKGRYPSELSGGQQQRVAVARALVLEPQVLLFDEPLSNLDAKLRRRVREDIRELQLSLNLTVAYVTHDQQEALAVSDRVIVMSNARVAQSGRPREIYEQPADLFVADFIGDANILDAELISVNGGQGRLNVLGVELDVPHRNAEPGSVKIAIRPESVLLNAAPGSNAATPGEILKASYLGAHIEYTVQTTHGPLFVVDRVTLEPFGVGTGVWLGLCSNGVTIVPEPSR